MGMGIETGAPDTAMQTARAFVDARSNRRIVAEYPGDRPLNLVSAYAIQDHALALWGDRQVGGWKVGRINSPDDERLGANRLAGPIFRDSIVMAEPDGPVTMPTIRGGFAAGESEFMIRLAPTSGKLPTTDSETIGWIDEVRIGIEVASSPYPAINADGPCVTISDHGNNAGLVLGACIPADEWTRLTEIEIASYIDGECVGCKSAATMLDGPLGAVRFLLRNLASRGIEVAPGTWVSSGAVTGVHEIAPGQTFRAEFAGVGDVECVIAK